mgnify:CR=1 FL=1
MKARLRTELVALFGRGKVEQAKQAQPRMDALTAQAIYQAAHELLELSGLPKRQRELTAALPETVQLALISWILQA